MNGVPDIALPQQPMAADAAGGGLPPAGEAVSGWAEQGMQIDEHGAQQDDLVAAKFKPGIKFKLGM